METNLIYKLKLPLEICREIKTRLQLFPDDFYRKIISLIRMTTTKDIPLDVIFKIDEEFLLNAYMLKRIIKDVVLLMCNREFWTDYENFVKRLMKFVFESYGKNVMYIINKCKNRGEDFVDFIASHIYVNYLSRMIEYIENSPEKLYVNYLSQMIEYIENSPEKLYVN